MGDHRVTIRIIMSFHGHRADSGNMWLNWTSAYDGLPSGADRWLRAQHSEGMHIFEEGQKRDYESLLREKAESIDRATYARLYEKYGGQPPGGKLADDS